MTCIAEKSQPITRLLRQIPAPVLAGYLDVAISNDIAYEVENDTATKESISRMHWLRSLRNSLLKMQDKPEMQTDE